jgi:hypothetical protein
MSPAGFEAEIPASSLDSLLDGAATGIGINNNIRVCMKITAERTSIVSLKDLMAKENKEMALRDEKWMYDSV